MTLFGQTRDRVECKSSLNVLMLFFAREKHKFECRE